jgi:hypothetical protein
VLDSNKDFLDIKNIFQEEKGSHVNDKRNAQQ